MGSFVDIFNAFSWDEVKESIYAKTEKDVLHALSASRLSLEDFKALVSPAAEPYLEQMAAKSSALTQKRYGKTIQLYAPMYLSNECNNICTYCGFSLTNKVRRKTLSEEEIIREIEAIKKDGFNHILLVTGEANQTVNIQYFLKAIQIIKPYFANISIEFQPLSVQEYRQAHDAGHGGRDPGNIGARAKEKDINLAVTLLVGKYIKENLPDVEVVYTRKDDSFPTLKERPMIANKNKADLFVSIHSNSAANKTAYGTETFVMGTKHFESNFDIVKRENSVILLEDNYHENYEGFDPTSPESYMMFNLMSKVHFENSVSLADNIEKQFRDRVGRKSRGVKQGPFYVLWTPSMPSVLVELGFLSNTTEEKFLMSQEGKEYMASAIYRSIRDYKESIESN